MSRVSIQYAEACFPTRWRILGARLRPFTVGHLVAMERVRSPFLSDEFVSSTASELASAVWICSRDWRDAQSLFDGEIDWRMKWLQWRVNFLSPIEAAQRMGMMRLYIAEAFQSTEPLMSEQKTKASSSPLVIMLQRSLMGELGMTRDELFSTPIGQAIFEHYGVIETGGALSFMTDEIYAFREHQAAMKAKEKATA